MSSIGKAGKDALLYLPGRLVVGLVGFVVLPVLTHVFPNPSDIGRYDLTMRFAQFLHLFLTAWLGTALVRFYAEYTTSEKEKTFYTVVLALCKLGIAIGFVISLALYWWGPDTLFKSFRDLLLLGGLVFASLSLFETDQMLLRAKGLAGTFSVSLIVATVLKFAVGFALIFSLRLGIEGILWGTAAIPFLQHFLWLRRYYGPRRLFLHREDFVFTRTMVAFGVPIALAGMLRFALNNGDRFFLKWLTGTDESVGMFAVGNLFGDQPISLLSSTLILAAFPEMSRLYDQESREHGETFLRQVSRVYLFITMPLVMLTVVGAPFVFPLIIGGKSKEAWDVVPWISFATFLIGLSNYGTLGLYMGKRSDKILACTILGLVANAGLNVFFIPRWGYVGCGIARLFANLLFLLAVSVGSHHYLRWDFPWKTLFKSLVASAISGSFLYFLARELVVNVSVISGMALLSVLAALGVGCYGLLLFAMKEIRPDHFQAVWTAVRARLR